jgi:hypothetical protein
MTAPQAELDINIAIGTSTAAAVAPALNISGLVAHYKMNDANCTTVDDTQGNDEFKKAKTLLLGTNVFHIKNAKPQG